ncbi:PREDICTED: serine/arginine-rich SC35-like splicing factor SCL28 isoform X2 [Populus euphratica]|uniref:Serine/arginine-rich SC35-like splicing factor SCL28 isoform X2 n=1 Tax=Populus euphratica TaxID=75702 RepID=A0AAJ6THS6_POPEU|nr:PREDICTED: serine/arginine-rich SC35-like splicing factor SCL28 isoform X2 [Populus euphratica]
MPRHRSRSRSYSPGRRSRTPPRGRKRYDDEDRHRDTRSYRDRRSPAPSGLLIRNLPLDASEPRGFGFVKYRYGEDAAEAKKRMDHKIIGGREIRIVFAEENRKTPQEMRRTPRTSDRHGGSHGGRTPPRSPRHRYCSYSRSPSPARHDSRDRVVNEDYCSPRRLRSISRSRSPLDERDFQVDQRSLSPLQKGRNPKERNHASRGSRTLRANSRSPSRSHSQSYGSR